MLACKAPGYSDIPIYMLAHQGILMDTHSHMLVHKVPEHFDTFTDMLAYQGQGHSDTHI